MRYQIKYRTFGGWISEAIPRTERDARAWLLICIGRHLPFHTLSSDTCYALQTLPILHFVYFTTQIACPCVSFNFPCRDYRPPIPPPSGPSVPPLKWFSAPCQTDLRTKASDRSNSTSWSFHVSVGSLCRNMMISCRRPKRHISTGL
jgi:hypothetical protein